MKKMRMNKQFVYDVSQTIIERNLIYPAESILVANSGGQDSMILFSLLYRLQIQWKWKLGVVHCDHQWNEGSGKHAESIYRLSYTTKHPFYLGIPIEKINSEEKARNWRYSIISQVAISHQYSTVTVGHTASDRVETLLFNLFRGTSFNGMKSLRWKRTINCKLKITINKNSIIVDYLLRHIYYRLFYNKMETNLKFGYIELVRPLLRLTRAQIQEEIRNLHIPVSIDKSNQSIKMRRNRIRHQLMPYLKKYFNPKIEHVLNGLAEIADCESRYLDGIIEAIYAKHINTSKQSNISLNLDIINSMPINIQRRVLKYFINLYSQTYLSFEQIELIRTSILNCNKISLSSHKRKYIKAIMCLPNNIELDIKDSNLVLKKIR